MARPNKGRARRLLRRQPGLAAQGGPGALLRGSGGSATPAGPPPSRWRRFFGWLGLGLFGASGGVVWILFADWLKEDALGWFGSAVVNAAGWLATPVSVPRGILGPAVLLLGYCLGARVAQAWPQKRVASQLPSPQSPLLQFKQLDFENVRWRWRPFISAGGEFDLRCLEARCPKDLTLLQDPPTGFGVYCQTCNGTLRGRDPIGTREMRARLEIDRLVMTGEWRQHVSSPMADR